MARDLYEKKHNHKFIKDVIHTEVRKRYRQKGKETGDAIYQTISTTLGALFTDRQQADYETPSFSDAKRVAEVGIVRAEHLIEQLSTLA